MTDWLTDFKGNYSTRQAWDLAFDDTLLFRLQEVLTHLPLQRQRSKSPILKTMRVVPCTSTVCIQLPVALLPINLILLDAREFIISSAEAGAFVCDTFDINCCCVTAKVQEDLSFAFQSFDGGFEALTSQTLRLRRVAFTSRKNPVQIQMKRILEYLQRRSNY